MITKEMYQTLNKKEKDVYAYVEKNRDKAAYMNVRELAEQCDVSTATILRFIKKLGLQSYKEFKFWCQHQNKEQQFNYYTQEVIDCLEKISTPIFEERLEEAAQLIKENTLVLFEGIGNSGGTAFLGARYFSNFGVFSLALNDPFYNLAVLPEKVVVVLISASGETKEIIAEVENYRRKNIPIIAITSNEDSTLGQMADLTLAYYLREQRKQGFFDMSSQIPAVHILERLAHMIKK